MVVGEVEEEVGDLEVEVEEVGVEEEVGEAGDLEAEVEEAGGGLQQYQEGLRHLCIPNQYILDKGKLLIQMDLALVIL